MTIKKKALIQNSKHLVAEISVIIPVYNVDKYLANCLDSVLKQTYKDFEVICVNDGSTDNSAQILAEYEKKDDRIKVINQENQGPGVARDNGVSSANGRYIYFMDADDTIHPELLEIVQYFAENFNADLVSFGFEEVHKQTIASEQINKSEIKYKQSDNPIFLGTTKEKYCINYNVWTKLYRKELLNGVNFLPNNRFEDFPHTFAVLARKPKTIVLRENLYFYTIDENSRSHKKGTIKQIKDYWEGINYIYDIYKVPELRKEMAFLKRTFIPNILKQQLGRCRRAEKEIRVQMYETFAEELRDLDKKGLISWRGHKLSRYLTIRKLIKKSDLKSICAYSNKKDSITHLISLENRIKHPELWEKYEQKQQISYFCLFGFIPFMKIVENDMYKQVFLFNIIPLCVTHRKY